MVDALRAGGQLAPEAALRQRREPPRSLAEARQRLALDAQGDLEASNATFADASEADRIGALYRAALKAWHAGNAWENPSPESGIDPETPSEVHRQGVGRCDGLGAQAPQRDCAIIGAGLDLTAMEIAGSDIFDAHLGRLANAAPSEALLAVRVKGVRDIAQAMARLDGSQTPPQLANFFDAQRLAYFCQSVRALDDLFVLADVDWAGRGLAEEAAVLLIAEGGNRQASPALADLLQRNGGGDRQLCRRLRPPPRSDRTLDLTRLGSCRHRQSQALLRRVGASEDLVQRPQYRPVSSDLTAGRLPVVPDRQRPCAAVCKACAFRL